MAALLPTTPRSGPRPHTRLLSDAILATIGIITMVGLVLTIAQPETLHGSVPMVVEASR